jgi:hypothetical protein
MKKEYAVGPDQNALLENAYFLNPTIGIYGQILPTLTLSHMREKEATSDPNWLKLDNSSSEENKS